MILAQATTLATPGTWERNTCHGRRHSLPGKQERHEKEYMARARPTSSCPSRIPSFQVTIGSQSPTNTRRPRLGQVPLRWRGGSVVGLAAPGGRRQAPLPPKAHRSHHGPGKSSPKSIALVKGPRPYLKLLPDGYPVGIHHVHHQVQVIQLESRLVNQNERRSQIGVASASWTHRRDRLRAQGISVCDLRRFRSIHLPRKASQPR
jgi:hypothetical protein